MSSVTRFIRQIPTSNTYYAANAITSGAASLNTSGLVFEFTPSASNTVGNYPPGSMSLCSLALQAAITAASNVAGAGNLILRDMGKTIQATVGGSGAVGSFRQVQLLNVNGTAGLLTFGVLGAANTPDAMTDYLTFYVPVVVLGLSNVSGGVSVDTVRAGGSL